MEFKIRNNAIHGFQIIGGLNGASAYQYAVSKGYTGTEEEFAIEQAASANNSARLLVVEKTAPNTLNVTITQTTATNTAYSFTKNNFDSVALSVQNGAAIFVKITDNRSATYKTIDLSKVYPAIWNTTLSQVEVSNPNIAIGFYLNGTTTANRGCVSNNTVLYIQIGAKFSATTGFYELNRLDNITEQQMANIYNYGRVIMSGCQENAVYGCQSSRNRTNWGVTYVQGEWTNKPNLQEAFRYNRVIETVNIPFWGDNNSAPVRTKNLRYTFIGCGKLRTIINAIDISECNEYFLQGAFIDCVNLEEVSLIKLNANILFTESPKLERTSILYLINNSINTTPITLTLHATAAARLTSEDIALASSKNITIA